MSGVKWTDTLQSVSTESCCKSVDSGAVQLKHCSFIQLKVLIASYKIKDNGCCDLYQMV